jgi:hypothetical protein
MSVTVYTVITADCIRFESLNKEDAILYAQKIYREETKIIPDITEQTREVIYHPKAGPL